MPAPGYQGTKDGKLGKAGDFFGSVRRERRLIFSHRKSILACLKCSGMMWPQALLTDHQGTLVKGPCLLQFPLGAVDACQGAQAGGCQRMIASPLLFPQAQRPLPCGFRLLVLPSSTIEERQIVEGIG